VLRYVLFLLQCGGIFSSFFPDDEFPSEAVLFRLYADLHSFLLGPFLFWSLPAPDAEGHPLCRIRCWPLPGQDVVCYGSHGFLCVLSFFFDLSEGHPFLLPLGRDCDLGCLFFVGFWGFKVFCVCIESLPFLYFFLLLFATFGRFHPRKWRGSIF